MPPFRAVCLGHACLDHLGLVDDWPAPDRKLRLRAIDRQGGGPAATAAAALARLGVAVRFVGVTGDDDAGRLIREGLREAGVDVAGMRLRRGRRSHVSFCLAQSRTGARNVFWHPGEAEELRPRELAPGLLDGAGLVLVDGRHPEAAAALVRRARRRGVRTFLDAGTLRPATRALLGMVDVCVASREFARDLAGSGRLEAMLRALAAEGPSLVGVTLGARGAAAREAGGPVVRQPALRVEVVDTTGAGDVWHGAFAYGLLAGRPLSWAMRFAAAAAGLKCRTLGGRRGLPGLAEVRRRLG